ncbi:MAG: amino acid ABC transporter permease [Beijerinckiaceae bacterium]
MQYNWDFGIVLQYANFWLRGLGITLAYSAGTIIGGLIVGLFAGLMLLSRRKWIRLPIHAYVEAFRCTPLLVQIIWFYYALPVVLKVDMPAWLAAGLGLTLYMGAFAAEIFRGGIISIDRGQWQAGRALGMTDFQLMRNIVLPQASKRMVAPFINQSITQLKNTSLLYVVAVPDLMYTGSVIVGYTFRPLEVYTSVGIMYFAILYPLTLWAARLEGKQ